MKIQNDVLVNTALPCYQITAHCNEDHWGVEIVEVGYKNLPKEGLYQYTRDVSPT